MTDHLVQNVSQVLKHLPEAQIVVVDNSSKDADKNKSALHELSDRIHYIRSKVNNRFHAYNLGLEVLNSQWTIFRTDDDLFHENVTSALTTIYPEADMIVTNYVFDGVLHNEITMERPIESVIFSSDVLARAGSFDTEENSDWKLMNNLPTSVRAVHSPEVILEKVEHGR